MAEIARASRVVFEVARDLRDIQTHDDDLFHHVQRWIQANAPGESFLPKPAAAAEDPHCRYDAGWGALNLAGLLVPGVAGVALDAASWGVSGAGEVTRAEKAKEGAKQTVACLKNRGYKLHRPKAAEAKPAAPAPPPQ